MFWRRCLSWRRALIYWLTLQEIHQLQFTRVLLTRTQDHPTTCTKLTVICLLSLPLSQSRGFPWIPASLCPTTSFMEEFHAPFHLHAGKGGNRRWLGWKDSWTHPMKEGQELWEPKASQLSLLEMKVWLQRSWGRISASKEKWRKSGELNSVKCNWRRNKSGEEQEDKKIWGFLQLHRSQSKLAGEMTAVAGAFCKPLTLWYLRGRLSSGKSQKKKKKGKKGCGYSHLAGYG